ncbi:MAG: hypothetical protein P1P58_06365, partial [Treponema sp.]
MFLVLFHVFPVPSARAVSKISEIEALPEGGGGAPPPPPAQPGGGGGLWSWKKRRICYVFIMIKKK